MISNSFKFTHQGGITISFSLQHFIEGFERSRGLEIQVKDTGTGISENDKKGLFKIFGVGNKHRDQFNMKGTGLGLTITQKLVEILGGRIHLESEESKGTTISFIVKEKSTIDLNVSRSSEFDELINDDISFEDYNRSNIKTQEIWESSNWINKIKIFDTSISLEYLNIPLLKAHKDQN